MSRAAGLDVSYWQSSTPDLTGQDFLIARVAYGTGLDTKFRTHIDNAKRAGLVTGAYVFGRNLDGAAQAEVMLRNAPDVDLFVLDLESDGSNVRMTDAQARAFIAHVQAAGKPCGLYHSLSGYPQLGQDWNWVAYWASTAPSIPWSIWQYGGSPLDRNWFNGTADDLRFWAKALPDTSEAGGNAMEIPIVEGTFRAWQGTVEVIEDGVMAIYSKTGQLIGIPRGTTKGAVAFAELGDVVLPGGIHTGGEAYLVGDQPAWFLKRNVKATAADGQPTPPPANEITLGPGLYRVP